MVRTSALSSMPTMLRTRAPNKSQVPTAPSTRVPTSELQLLLYLTKPSFLGLAVLPAPTVMGGCVGPLTGAPRPSRRTA